MQILYNNHKNCLFCRFLRGLAISTLGGILGGGVGFLLGLEPAGRFYAAVAGVVFIMPLFFKIGRGTDNF